jgi:hypothetical protein
MILKVAGPRFSSPLREINQRTRDFAGTGRLLPHSGEVLSW